MAVSGLPGGSINPNSGNVIRPPTDGQVVSRPGAGRPTGSPPIADGALVEGLVTAKEGDAYSVRIGSQSMLARSTVPLFVGQRFRAVWDASTNPPMLRLQQSDMAMLARFAGRDQQLAAALLTRGLPVDDAVMLAMRQFWMKSGGNPSDLGTLAELWARGLPMNQENIVLMTWYFGLAPSRVLQIWKKIRERIHGGKFGSPKELLKALEDSDDPDVKKFLKAHALASKPARKGLDPIMLLAPSWWPVGDDANPTMARVSYSREEMGERQVWWLTFEMEGNNIGDTVGDVMTNGRALSVSLRMKDELMVNVVDDVLPELREELKEVQLDLQHLSVGRLKQDERARANRSGAMGLDMEI